MCSRRILGDCRLLPDTRRGGALLLRSSGQLPRTAPRLNLWMRRMHTLVAGIAEYLLIHDAHDMALRDMPS